MKHVVRLSVLVALLLISGVTAHAQNAQNCWNSSWGSTMPCPVSIPGSFTPVTVGTGSAKAMDAATRRSYLALLNQSSTATVACNFGGTAVINGAGSVTLGPLGGFVWDVGFVPPDQINCIASASSTPLTIESN